MTDQEKILNHINKFCYVAVPHAATLPQVQFSLARRCGLGASDASVLLGLMNKWTTVEDLIQQKVSQEYSEKDAEIAKKVQVRMGTALEPLNLEIFSELTNNPLVKPQDMYAIIEYPYLIVDFDGVGIWGDSIIPIEAKYVTLFADKFYNWNKAMISANGITAYPEEKDFTKIDILAHCAEAGTYYGIPDYYYAQLQQQMMGLNAPYGFLSVLRGKTSEVYGFCAHADEWLQNQIAVKGYNTWKRIERQRK